MGLTVTFFDAADKYGFGSMSPTPALLTYNSAKEGTLISTTNSWTGSLQVGQPVSITSTYTGGITEKLSFIYTSSQSGTITSLVVSNTATGELLYRVAGTVPFSLSTYGTDTQIANMLRGDDEFTGSRGNNDLIGYGGNDRIDGGDGIDTAYFRGFKSQYQITRSGTAMSVSGPDGTDALLNIERLHFDDVTVSYDTIGNSAQAYRLYQAAFNRVPDAVGLGWQIAAMDKGTPLLQIAQNFMASPEFRGLYGTAPTDTQLVSLLYQNVLHRAPQQIEVDFWVGILNGTNPNSHQTPAEVLTNFSESPENQAQVVGVLQGGVTYTTY